MDETRVDTPPLWTSPAGRPMVNAAEESDRLRQVEALGIAVDRPDDSLQEVVDRVADIYRVGLCSVNLVLRDRQIFKTWSGDLPEELAAMRRVDRQKSLCTYVVASHSPLVIEDMPALEEWRDQYFHVEHGVRFYAGVPLVTSSGHAMGTLCLADGSPRQFSASELERLQVFARRIAAELQLSGEVERARSLQAELEVTAKYAATLAELSVRLDEAAGADEETAALAALETMAATARLSWGLVAVVQGDAAWAPCATGEMPPDLQRLVKSGLRKGPGALWELLNGIAPIFVDAANAAEILPGLAQALPAAFALIPLGTFSAVAPAMLIVAREGMEKTWSAQDRLFLESSARILGASLRRFQRWQALETATLTDGLTGLRNRRALERLLADPGELGPSFRVWVADLHGFKTLNDSVGHAVGDLCLQQVATALSEQIRPRDSRFLFRLGGDEFALALPVPESVQPGLGTRLQNAVARLAAEAYPTLDLHLDLGEAEVPREAGDLQEALKLADARMYEAKRARRERAPE